MDMNVQRFSRRAIYNYVNLVTTYILITILAVKTFDGAFYWYGKMFGMYYLARKVAYRAQ